jgi:uncharacterized protein (DUF302 family)
MESLAAGGIAEQISPVGFDATVERLKNAIKAAGLALFAEIDHAANARAAGLAMPPAIVLIYGHAKGGTPVMLAAPLTALDLPLRVLVQARADGQTAIAFHPIVAMLRGFGVAEDLAARLQPAQQLLITALAQ